MKNILFAAFIGLVLAGCSFSFGEGETGITFCKSCSDELDCEGENESFPAGQVTVRLVTEDNFDTDKVQMSLYKVDGKAEELIDRGEFDVDPEWNSLCKEITINEPGKFKVTIYGKEDEKLGEGTVEITGSSDKDKEKEEV